MNKNTESNSREQELTQIAKNAANIINSTAFSTHRGKAYAGDGVYILFGNDGYSADRRSEASAFSAVEEAVMLGCEIGDIQANDDEYTWALAVACNAEQADQIVATMNEVWAETEE